MPNDALEVTREDFFFGLNYVVIFKADIWVHLFLLMQLIDNHLMDGKSLVDNA